MTDRTTGSVQVVQIDTVSVLRSPLGASKTLYSVAGQPISNAMFVSVFTRVGRLLVVAIMISGIVGSFAPPSLAQPPPEYGNAPKRIVYLTFDDGPDQNTPQFLAILAKYNVPGTFFITGRNTLNFPDEALQIAVDGHAIANHTYSHEWLTRVEPAAELEKAQTIIREVTGVETTCYRPPYGSTNDEVRAAAASLGLTEWLWDVDTHDWRRSVSTEEVVASLESSETFDYTIGNSGPVVLMHDGGPDGPRTLDALELWLADNHDRYEFRILEGCGGWRDRIEDTSTIQSVRVGTAIGMGPAGMSGASAASSDAQLSRSALYSGFAARKVSPAVWGEWEQHWFKNARSKVVVRPSISDPSPSPAAPPSPRSPFFWAKTRHYR